MIKRYLEECNEKESVRSVRSVRVLLVLLPCYYVEKTDEVKEFA